MYALMMGHTVEGQFCQVVPITALVGLVYALGRYRQLKKRGKDIAWGAEITRLLFVCYLTGLVNLVLVPVNLWTAIWFYLFNGYSGTTVAPLFSGAFNFVPTLVRVLRGEYVVGSWVRTMIGVNALMFVPMGVFLPLVSKKVNGRNIAPLALAIPAAIELIQPIIGRSFDVDDIIMNGIGILAGYLFCRLAKRAARTVNHRT